MFTAAVGNRANNLHTLPVHGEMGKGAVESCGNAREGGGGGGTMRGAKPGSAGGSGGEAGDNHQRGCHKQFLPHGFASISW